MGCGEMRLWSGRIWLELTVNYIHNQKIFNNYVYNRKIFKITYIIDFSIKLFIALVFTF